MIKYKLNFYKLLTKYKNIKLIILLIDKKIQYYFQFFLEVHNTDQLKMEKYLDI